MPTDGTRLIVGMAAFVGGEALDACPYADYRKVNNRLTWSRAFICAWGDGWLWARKHSAGIGKGDAVKSFAFAALLACGLFAGHANATTLTVTWTHPTSNVDGTPIPASGAGSLVSTRVEYASCGSVAGTFGTKVGEIIVNVPATSASIGSLAANTCYAVRAYSKNTYGSESGPSNVTTKVTPTPVPNPPILVTIAATLVELRMGTNGYWIARQVGYAPKGTTCTSVALLRNYHQVVLDNATIKVDPATIKGVIAGECSIA